MEIIYIYWPPAVWKLTTAKELSKLTWYKIYHNHLSHDLVSSILSYKENEDIFFPLIKDINLLFISKIPKNINGIIFTNCYEEKKDYIYINKLLNIFNTLWAKTHFIKLYCDKSLLFKRVENETRKNTTKLKDKNILSKILLERNFEKNIKGTKTITINNSQKSAKDVAILIKNHFKL